MFQSITPVSPVKQDFVWLAEYADGGHLSEFDFTTHKENGFYDIKCEQLIRFGLIGHGSKLYFESLGGVFKLNGTMIEIIYQVNGKDYYLTGQNQMYNDIIQYKDAETLFNPFDKTGTTIDRISQYNFGYKTKIKIDGINFEFKAICQLPFNESAHLNFRIVADKKLNGKLIIKRNGFMVDEFDAPLKKGVGGELNWQLK